MSIEIEFNVLTLLRFLSLDNSVVHGADLSYVRNIPQHLPPLVRYCLIQKIKAVCTPHVSSRSFSSID